MKQTGKCPKCGCSDIVADAMAIDRGGSNIPQEMSLATFRKPEALFFKGQQRTTVSAWVCAECGYIEFYADHPKSIQLPKT
jgi:predicted nucleic-acid-binding Zn-ribbon protein